MLSRRFLWTTFAILGAVIGAFYGFCFVFMFNLYVGRIVLPRYWCGYAGAILGATCVLPPYFYHLKRRTGLAELGHRLGVEFNPGPVRRSRLDWTRAFGFREWLTCEDRFSAVIDGIPVEMFDVIRMRAPASTTVISLRLLGLPSFCCQPRLPKSSRPSVSFDPPVGDRAACDAVHAFELVHRLTLCEATKRSPSVSTEDEVRRFMHPSRLAALACCSGWKIRSENEGVLLEYGRFLPVNQRVEEWRKAIDLLRGLTVPIDSNLPPILCVPGREYARQQYLWKAAEVGALVGSLVPFFGVLIVGTSLVAWDFNKTGNIFFKTTDGHWGPLFILILLPMILIGSLVGPPIARARAEKRYRVGAPLVSDAWSGCGALIGIYVGLLGMGLVLFGLATDPMRGDLLLPALLLSLCAWLISSLLVFWIVYGLGLYLATRKQRKQLVRANRPSLRESPADG